MFSASKVEGFGYSGAHSPGFQADSSWAPGGLNLIFKPSVLWIRKSRQLQGTELRGFGECGCGTINPDQNIVFELWPVEARQGGERCRFVNEIQSAFYSSCEAIFFIRKEVKFAEIPLFHGQVK
jgi:hypothetical protein